MAAGVSVLILVRIIGHFDGNVSGQLIDHLVPLVLKFQHLVAHELISLDLDIQITDVRKQLIDFIHIAVFGASRTVELCIFILHGRGDSGSCVVELHGGRIHSGTELALIDRIVDLGRILHVRERRLDIVEGSAESLQLCLIEVVIQRIQRVTHRLVVIYFRFLVAVLNVQKLVTDLIYITHRDAVADIGIVRITEEVRVAVVDTVDFQSLSGIALCIHIGEVLTNNAQLRLIGTKRRKRCIKT